MAETEDGITRAQRWYKEKIETDPEYVDLRRVRNKLRAREYRAKKAAEDPNWLEDQRRKARESKQLELQDPERRAARNLKVQAYRRRRREADPEYYERKRRQGKARYEKRKAENPKFVLEQSQAQRQRKRGIDEAEFRRLIDEHNDLCGICKQPEKAYIRGTLCRLAIDHDHATGKVRGLLCKQCNLGLGKFEDDPVRLRAAAAYIEKHNNSPVGTPYEAT